MIQNTNSNLLFSCTLSDSACFFRYVLSPHSYNDFFFQARVWAVIRTYLLSQSQSLHYSRFWRKGSASLKKDQSIELESFYQFYHCKKLTSLQLMYSFSEITEIVSIFSPYHFYFHNVRLCKGTPFPFMYGRLSCGHFTFHFKNVICLKKSATRILKCHS